MVNGFKVITLCGSTRFKDEFLEVQKRLTLEGNIVISVGLFGHSGDNEVWTEGVKDMLDRQHLAKIDLADEIFVINVGGYIGESTRREIAYAEFKGKTITYMDNSKKTSIYENYAALVELHDAGRISDEDFEQAGRDFDEKRNAAIAEYNACNGPWPYQWRNIDAVVCGILQQRGTMSIDYTDLKFFYEADIVSEIRIKGKGANDEEQLQSIIDTIRNGYMDLLKSSKKLAVTLSGPSNQTAYLEKIADCLNGFDIVWQIKREGKEMSLSIIGINNEYSKWVNKACDFIKIVGPQINMPAGAMQSDISMALGNDINIMFLGHDAHEVPRGNFTFEYNDYIRIRFKKGNPCWKERNEKWDIWKNLRNNFIKVFGDSTLMDDMDHLVFTNAIFFTGDNIDEVLNQINKTDTSVESKCMELTRDLVFDILQPKLLVCFSVKDVFDKLINSIRRKDGFNEKLTIKKFKPFHIKHTCAITQFKGTTILGIPHPSGAHGVLASLPAIVRIINDLAKEEEIEKVVATKELFLDSNEAGKNKVEESQLKNRVNLIKTRISKDGTNQWIDAEGALIHEYYCKGIRGSHKKENGTITIRLKIDDEKRKFVLSTISDGNHPEDFRNLLCDYCENKGWTKSDCEFSFSKDISTNDDIIVEFMTSLLEKMKTYREKDTKE